ncbi:hypothetical protein [Pedobacter sp. MC2016-24]|uniref:hypothetical protein n=1 Tax=Pedobacter sp. MC2016-24 TaxID=2780090 RepID=UPI0018826768|nr:hypothetical protein [Pedobacter sp. MC2016-24]MBE9601950.1 hypothetical protein [Pedobacter sp. MC2016-24]
MKVEQRIPCPNCSTLIPFDTAQLLLGVNFECPNCHSKIGLATESNTIVEKAVQKLENIKKTK